MTTGRYTINELQCFDIAIIVNNQKTLDEFQDKTGLYDKKEFDNIDADTCLILARKEDRNGVYRKTIKEAEAEGFDVISFYQAFEIPQAPRIQATKKYDAKGHGYWG